MDPTKTTIDPNPADPKVIPEAVRARKRIPMDVPRRRLETPEIPGYYLYWPLESMVEAFLQAGYVKVDQSELNIAGLDLATSSSAEGNSSLGSDIRVYAGLNANNKPEYHVLMKLPLEFHNEDQAQLMYRNAQVLQSIFVDEHIVDGGQSVSPVDDAMRYVKTAKASGAAPLFHRPTKKARS